VFRADRERGTGSDRPTEVDGAPRNWVPSSHRPSIRRTPGPVQAYEEMKPQAGSTPLASTPQPRLPRWLYGAGGGQPGFMPMNEGCVHTGGLQACASGTNGPPHCWQHRSPYAHRSCDIWHDWPSGTVPVPHLWLMHTQPGGTTGHMTPHRSGGGIGSPAARHMPQQPLCPRKMQS